MALKIGILTLPISENYGGILQALTLYRLLHNQGHNVVLIYKEAYQSQVLWKKIAVEILLKIPFHNFKNIKSRHMLLEERKKRRAFHRTFINEEIFKISESLYTKNDLEKFVEKEKFDAVIVGSDQVWRKEYINDIYYKSYFLDFVNGINTKKIAYASSFGKDYWEGKSDIEEVSMCIKDFDSISTRELSGVEICKDTFGFENAEQTLDPTLLMSREFYYEIISKYSALDNITKAELLSYVLDESEGKKEIINYIKKKFNLQNVNHLKGYNYTNKIYTVPEWLASFSVADFVITDSFHGMVFSIIFEKNFIVIGNHNRGLERFSSLLNLVGLEDRLIFELDDIKDKKIDNINYKVVNEFLDKNKKKSLNFLFNALVKDLNE